MTEAQRQQAAFELLVSKFPKRYGVKTSQYLRGLLQALAVGDGFIDTEVEAVRDNLIAVTASGRFLDRAAGRYGIVRGQGTGVLDADYRKLVPVLGLSPKQISHILLKIIDVAYGPYASHANSTAGAAEPYALQTGFSLKVSVDGEVHEIFFEPADAINLSAATALEIATAISKKTNGKIIGSVISDAKTGNKFLNVRTSTIGSQGFIQVIGGDAQSKFDFPSVRPVSYLSVSTYSVARYLGTDEMIYTVTSGPVPNLKAAGVSRGDFVTIRSDSGFDVANTGTFEVSFIGSNFFRVKNGSGVAEVGVTHTNLDDFTFYRPTLSNVLLSNRPAAVLETAPRELTIILPVTSPIVKRTLKGGHHFHQGLTTIQSTAPTTATIASVTGFPTSGAFSPTLSRKFAKGIVSSIGATTVTLIDAQNFPTKGAFWSANVRQFFYFSGRTGNTLTGVSPAPPAALSGSNISYVEKYKYTGISGSTLTGVYPNPTGLDGAEVVASGANIDSQFIGSFMYDSDATFIAAENLTTTTETIKQGSVKTILFVNNVSTWPDKGYFSLEFATETQEAPIKYLAKVGSTGLIIDPSHVFERDHIKGVGIRLIRQLGPYVPRASGKDYAVYSTSTSPARDLIASYLRLVAASGVKLRFIIKIPDQKWEVLPNLFTTNPLDTELVTV